MFRGQSLLKIDAKGRISIPARFREIISVRHAGRLVLSQGFFPEFPHLLLVPMDAWEEFERNFGSEALFDTDLGMFQVRLRTMGACEEARIDEHGRILVPSIHRDYAGCTSEIACVGMGRYLSLWKPALLEKAMARAEKNLADIRGNLAARGGRSTGP